MNRAASNPPAYSLRRNRAYEKLKKIVATEVGQVRRLHSILMLYIHKWPLPLLVQSCLYG